MEFLEYSADTDSARVSLPISELAALSSVLLGVLNTFSTQDPTILGVSQQRLEELSNGARNVMSGIATKRGRGVISGIGTERDR